MHRHHVAAVLAMAATATTCPPCHTSYFPNCRICSPARDSSRTPANVTRSIASSRECVAERDGGSKCGCGTHDGIRRARIGVRRKVMRREGAAGPGARLLNDRSKRGRYQIRGNIHTVSRVNIPRVYNTSRQYLHNLRY